MLVALCYCVRAVQIASPCFSPSFHVLLRRSLIPLRLLLFLFCCLPFTTFLSMDLLGGYASSDDEGAAKPVTSASSASSHTPAAAAAAAADDKAERKRLKHEKRERKAAKQAASSAAAVVAPVSLNAPLPAPKLALPSASALLSAAATKAPTFLQLQASDRLREAMEEAAETGVGLSRSIPSGIHQEASARTLQQQQALDAAAAAREAALSAPEKESLRAKRKQLAHAQARVAEGEAAPGVAAAYAAASGAAPAGKKARPNDGTGGPARSSDQVKDKEKLKRAKGQSGVETWKPEAWMQNRQNYDS